MGQQLSLSLYFFFSHSHLTHDFVSESNIKIKETKSLLSGELWKIHNELGKIQMHDSMIRMYFYCFTVLAITSVILQYYRGLGLH